MRKLSPPAAVLAAALISSVLPAADKPLVLDVWPGDAPGEKGDIGPEHLLPARSQTAPVKRLTDVSRPTITVYKPPREKDTGAAVLICPGGGYNILAIDKEGTEVADWLNGIGVSGIVLKYRVPRRKDRPKHLAPLQDAQRAMSLVRAHAEKWGIDPGRIGILGFSAGGHLAAAASTNFDRRQYKPIDEIDKVSCRPDFTVLAYPAYLTEGDALAPEIRPSAQTPPIFFVHADDDHISSENSIALYLALKRAHVPVELHIYAAGGHGFGLRPSDKPCSTWPDRCRQWMTSRSLLHRKDAKKDAAAMTPRASIARQLDLLRAGNVEQLKTWFTDRQKPRITAEAVQKAERDMADLTLDDLVHRVEFGEFMGRKTARITMKNGRTLTTLILIDHRWLADTVWFR